jgi:hypothetical protein
LIPDTRAVKPPLMEVSLYGRTVGDVRGTSEPSASDTTPVDVSVPISGAAAVKPPVLYRFESGLIIPALPICKTEELLTASTRK